MRQNKKLTWFQVCFLGDVRVIWCSSLGYSLFQIYVMNFVEIVINYYLHITSYVSLAIASCTHYTSYSLLNFVHNMMCEFVLAIQDYMFLDFDANWLKKLIFIGSGLNSSAFEKLLISYSCISLMKYCALRSFYIKLLYFFKI